MYELLWLKQLSQLFGNTAYASSAVLCAFFAGLAIGGYYWGNKSKTISNSLRMYAILEIGIAATALLFILIFKFYYFIYSPLFNLFGHRLYLFATIKFLLALALLFLPCFFMGGTIPVIANAFIHHKDNLGKRASFLYAINTVGAAIGAFATGFYLILYFGVRSTYITAVAINVMVSIIVWLISSKYSIRTIAESEPSPKDNHGTTKTFTLSSRWVLSYAFFSGFLTLCLEVSWIRMMALVLHNSVYSFSIVLIVFILALAIGSFIANRLSLLDKPAASVLNLLFILSGLFAGLSPTIFTIITDNLSYMASDAGWVEYIVTVFRNAVIVIMIPGIIAGTIFPYLLKVSQETFKGNIGSIIGNISCLNTLGAAIGAFITGFFLLQLFGIWMSLLLISIAYFILALIFSFKMEGGKAYFIGGTVLSIILLVTIFNPILFPIIKTDEDEELLETWEGSYGSVAVVKGGENLSLVLDNYYTLGDLSDYAYERMQAHLPLLLHPDPDKVYFLGMGTGITAGASLVHPVSQVTTCELVPEVITAAKKYFSPYVFNLFTDDRSEVIAEDGRNFLLGKKGRYDVIISDLFTPWGAGTGSLYTVEHYGAVFSHLNKNGLFAQWLPLYQLSKREFDIIAKTMLEVFPQVTLWKGDLFAKDVIVSLVGQKQKAPLNPEALVKQFKYLPWYKRESDDFALALPLIFYSGNISENSFLFRDVPVNTDNRPLVEYLSPITHREQKAKKASWFDSHELLRFYEKLRKQTPPEKDPFLSSLSIDDINAVRAGFSYFKGAVLEEDNKIRASETYYKKFFDYFPSELALRLEKRGFQYIGK